MINVSLFSGLTRYSNNVFAQFGQAPGNPIPCNLTSSSYSLYLSVSVSVSQRTTEYGDLTFTEQVKACLLQNKLKEINLQDELEKRNSHPNQDYCNITIY